MNKVIFRNERTSTVLDLDLLAAVHVHFATGFLAEQGLSSNLTGNYSPETALQLRNGIPKNATNPILREMLLFAAEGRFAVEISN
jgi:hypothetical protein